MAEHSKEYLVSRGREANKLLNGKLFPEIMAEARVAFQEEWEAAQDLAHREMCWAKVAGLGEMERQLRRILNEGEYASREPDER